MGKYKAGIKSQAVLFCPAPTRTTDPDEGFEDRLALEGREHAVVLSIIDKREQLTEASFVEGAHVLQSYDR